MPIMIGTYFEDDPNIFKMVEGKVGFKLDCARAADWHSNWNDVESNYMVRRIRDNLPGAQVQHMSVMFPSSLGKNGSKNGWTELGKGTYNANMVRSFKNKLSALPTFQTVLYISTSYETNANFWFNDIAACGGVNAYRDAIKNARICANEAELSYPGKKIVLVHNPVNENWKAAPGADWKATFVDGSHGAVFCNYYMKPQYRSNNLDNEWKHWTGAYIGLDSQIAFCKEKGVPWGMPEVGFLSDDKYDIRPFVKRLGDYIVANISNCACFLPWVSDKDYPGQIYAGRSPMAAQAVTDLMKQLKAAQGNAPTVPSNPNPTPTNPTPTPTPTITPNQQILLDINSEMYLNRGKFSEADNTLFLSVEDSSYWPLVAAGIKSGTPPAGSITDPVTAMYRVWQTLRKPSDTMSTEPKALAQKVLNVIKPVLLAAGLDVSDPVVVEPPQPPDQELVAVRAKIASAEAAIRAALAELNKYTP